MTKQELLDKTTKLFALYKDLFNKAIESDDIEVVNALYNELQYFKPLIDKSKEKRDDLFIIALNGKEEAKINGYNVTYTQPNRRYIDPKKVD